MKSIFILIILLSFSSLNAQLQMDDVYLGGSIRFVFDSDNGGSTKVFQFSPEVGYATSNSDIFGVKGLVSVSLRDRKVLSIDEIIIENEDERYILSLMPFYKLYYLQTTNISLFTQFYGHFSLQKQNNIIEDYGFGAGLNLGLAWFINKSISLEARFGNLEVSRFDKSERTIINAEIINSFAFGIFVAL